LNLNKLLLVTKNLKEFKMPKKIIKEIKNASRKRFSAEEKIRIVLEGLRGEITIAELCRKEAIYPANYYKWSKEFLEAGKNGLTLETKRSATSDEVKVLRKENDDLKRALGELMLEVTRLKKNLGLLGKGF
jgi:transposase